MNTLGLQWMVKHRGRSSVSAVIREAADPGFNIQLAVSLKQPLALSALIKLAKVLFQLVETTTQNCHFPGTVPVRSLKFFSLYTLWTIFRMFIKNQQN